MKGWFSPRFYMVKISSLAIGVIFVNDTNFLNGSNVAQLFYYEDQIAFL
jgi:hypothetical protein